MVESTSCPYCFGEIHPEAKKCRHCGEWVNGHLQEESGRIDKNIDKNKNGTKTCPVCRTTTEDWSKVCPECEHEYEKINHIIDAPVNGVNGNNFYKPDPEADIKTCPECYIKVEEWAKVCNNCFYDFETGKSLSSRPEYSSGKLKYFLIPIFLIFMAGGVMHLDLSNSKQEAYKETENTRFGYGQAYMSKDQAKEFTDYTKNDEWKNKQSYANAMLTISAIGMATWLFVWLLGWIKNRSL